MKLTSKILESMIKEEIHKFLITDSYGEESFIEFDTSEKSEEYYLEQSIKDFQAFYRGLSLDTRYFFSRWLRRALLKDLSYQEAISICADLQASSKGQSQPKNPNKS